MCRYADDSGTVALLTRLCESPTAPHGPCGLLQGCRPSTTNTACTHTLAHSQSYPLHHSAISTNHDSGFACISCLHTTIKGNEPPHPAAFLNVNPAMKQPAGVHPVLMSLCSGIL